MRLPAVCVMGWVLCGCASAPRHPPAAPVVGSAAATQLPLHVTEWRSLRNGEGSYYTVIEDVDMPFIRARYRQNQKAVPLAYALDDQDRAGARLLRWRWRALKFPERGRECKKGSGDSAASVYVTWKRGLRWYSLKYTWSFALPTGTTCRNRRSPLVAQDTVVLASGGPLNVWRTEEIDLSREFREYFEGGDPEAPVPKLVGIGIFTDGDQTGSDSEADYGGFVLVR